MTRHKKKPLVQLRSIYQWHRYAGLIAALFIIIIAITGFMLNHGSGLKLDKTYIKADWLLNYYGIAAPKNIPSFAVKHDWVSQWDKQIYLNKKLIHKSRPKIIGAVNFNNMVIISQQSVLLVFTEDGELIERVTGTEGVPSGIEAIGISDDNQFTLRSSNGIFTTNEDFLFWQAAPSAIVVWSDTEDLPEQLYKSLLELYRGHGLKLDRVLFDIHSGRLFGELGIYFVDFIAFLIIFLALSGVWLWTMRAIKQKNHTRHKK